MSRHCGMKAPKNVKSDHEFFRIAFKSNDKFDGTGFEAFYQFRPNEGSILHLIAIIGTKVPMRSIGSKLLMSCVH